MGEAERMMQLFERLPEEDRGELIHMAEFLAKKADPVAWALENAPEDDEPTTEEDLIAIAEAKADIAAGRLTSAEELKAELGL